jgi:hypothetical protein
VLLGRPPRRHPESAVGTEPTPAIQRPYRHPAVQEARTPTLHRPRLSPGPPAATLTPTKGHILSFRAAAAVNLSQQHLRRQAVEAEASIPIPGRRRRRREVETPIPIRTNCLLSRCRKDLRRPRLRAEAAIPPRARRRQRVPVGAAIPTRQPCRHSPLVGTSTPAKDHRHPLRSLPSSPA